MLTPPKAPNNEAASSQLWQFKAVPILPRPQCLSVLGLPQRLGRVTSLAPSGSGFPRKRRKRRRSGMVVSSRKLIRAPSGKSPDMVSISNSTELGHARPRRRRRGGCFGAGPTPQMLLPQRVVIGPVDVALLPRFSPLLSSPETTNLPASCQHLNSGRKRRDEFGNPWLLARSGIAPSG
jgi:hypothetical protein